MARAKQITADKLERLGVRRLAEILDEHAGADASLRRKLTIALGGARWGRQARRDTVAGPLAERDARLAAEHMWDVVGLADPVLTRIHGSAQAAVEVFEAAIEDLATKQCLLGPESPGE